MPNKENKSRSKRKRRQAYAPSPEERADWARQRRSMEGKLINQKGFEGALVLEHIKGSMYLVRLPDGREVYMSHKKERIQPHRGPVTGVGWSLWKEKT